MDSHRKFADDFFGLGADNTIFKNVQSCDLDEVKVLMAMAMHDLVYADNFSAFPLSMTEQFKESERNGCCGRFNSQVKCLSGNIYWIGCNYGH